MYKLNQRLWCCIGDQRKVSPCEYVGQYVCNEGYKRGHVVRVIVGTLTTIDSDQLFESESQARRSLYNYCDGKAVEIRNQIEKLKDDLTWYEERKRWCNGVTYV